MTIEDPVEYVFPSINQIQTNDQAGLTFATGLKSILRQDPDVILVGEIRDVETARVAVQSALTGHFVVSSLHATDAVSALHRFLDMGIESFLIASSVLAVVGQRLVRRICPSCKARYNPTAEELAFYEESGGPPKDTFYIGTGCNFCSDTGYQDRIGVYELLGDDAGDQAPHRRMGDPGRATQPRPKAGNAHVAHGGDQSRGRGRHDRGRSDKEHVHTMSDEQDHVQVPLSALSTSPGQGRRGVEMAIVIRRRASRPRPARIPALEVTEKRKLGSIEITKKKVPRKEIMHFSRQMGVFMKAGIPIMEALEVIELETTEKLMKKVIHEMIDDLRAGDTFAAAAASHPEAFPNFYVGILESAELTGNLDTVLDQLADYIERDVEARSTLTSALIYPAVVACMSVGVVIVLATFVMPRFVVFFNSLHAKLPLPTRMLLSASSFFSHYWYAILGTLSSRSSSDIVAMRRSAKGRAMLDGIILKLPVLGLLVQAAVLERVCRVLSSMLKAGVDLPQAMAVTAEFVQQRGVPQWTRTRSESR